MDNPVNQALQAHDPQASRLAAAVHRLGSDVLTSFDRTYALTQLAINARQFDATAVRNARAEFDAQILALGVEATFLWHEGAQLLHDIYGKTRQTNRRGATHVEIPVYQLLKLKLQNSRAEAEQLSQQDSELSGRPLAPILAERLLDPRMVLGVKRTVDFLAMSELNGGIQDAGTGIFSRKQAVPVIDGDTTDLCRYRMAWQVQPWDGYFVDAVTGAQWLHPPFVEGGLPPSESFHFCRTTQRPY